MRLTPTALCLGAALFLGASAQAAVISRLELQGSPGDGLTGGASVVLDGSAGRFTTLVSARIAVDSRTFEMRSVPYGISVFYVANSTSGCLPLACVARLDFSAPDGLPLAVGTYAGAQGIDLALGSARFASAGGSFTIGDLAFAPGSSLMLPMLDRLSASFTLQGEGNAGAVTGRILINEPVNVPEPATLALLLVGLAGLARRRGSSASRKDWTGGNAGGSVPQQGRLPRPVLSQHSDQEEETS